MATVAVAISACSSGKMAALTADNFKVVPTPMVLQGNSVPVTIYGAFPEKYMNKGAIITVTPELRNSKGKKIRGKGTTFQGEKVNGNNQTISYLIGGRYTMRDVFTYSDDMHKSSLYMTFSGKIGKDKINIPDVRVSYGIIATASLYRKALVQGGGIIAPDTFQYIRQASKEASIKFLVNQAVLRQSELKNNSIQDFIQLLKQINAERDNYSINEINVLAYASPEGAAKINTKLASQRQKESTKYVDEQLRKNRVKGAVTGDYTAEDWEGFQELVQASNIQDKDLILRVLNMYKDPEEREQQIKNLSHGFQELAKEILPQLRRARMIINYESVGRSDDKIEAQYNADPKKLSADELLYFATLQKTAAESMKVYATCASIYPDDYRAYNNQAAMAIAMGDNEAAKRYAHQALGVNPRAGEPQANLAILCLEDGDVKMAEAYMSKASNSNDLRRIEGAVNFAKGNYSAAAENYKHVYNNMAALAQIMAQDYVNAKGTFSQIKEPDALTDYIHAVMCARINNKYAMEGYLNDALKKDPSLKAYADTDLEFSVFSRKKRR